MIPIYQGIEGLKWLEEVCRTDLIENIDLNVQSSVKEIIEEIRVNGDSALKKLAKRFGDNLPSKFKLDQQEIEQAITRITPENKSIIDQAAANIKNFASAVMSSIKPVKVSYAEFSVGLDHKPVNRAACYVPGGRYALPSTALMTSLSAQAAGVPEICLVCPKMSDEVIYAGHLAGVKEFYRIGGAQAIAALCFGTESINAVNMIVGPGNAYVTEAKKQLQGIVGIDMLAGPSEVAIIADGSTPAQWVAIDMLSQAEHDPDSRAYLFCDNNEFAKEVLLQIENLVQTVSMPSFIKQSLNASAIVVLPSIPECIQATNAVAPEHLQLHIRDPLSIKAQLKNYGALFIGAYSTVPCGDYIAGPNHTLPTNRAARFSGGLSPLTFLRAQSWINILPGAKTILEQTQTFAQLEGLNAHSAAAAMRLAKS